MAKCYLCPKKCGADRAAGQTGLCHANDKIKVARIAPHYWEEPCLSGDKGSGAVFFSGCSLGCIYCQNKKISRGAGKIYSPFELVSEIKKLEASRVHNINFVTPTHYTNEIVALLNAYKPKAPVVWNSSGYELPESLELLKGKIDIFLPDYKYGNPVTAERYSGVFDYPTVAQKAIEKMVSLTGSAEFDQNGMMKKGVIVRHLVLPGKANESIKALETLYSLFGNDIYYSIMSQYTPVEDSLPDSLSRKLGKFEYKKVIDFAERIGIENGFVQSGKSAKESFIPEFETE